MCFSNTYDQHFHPHMPSIFNTKCTKSLLMLGCRRTSSSTINLLAWAPRSDILMKTEQSKTHSAKGTEWYSYEGNSLGFAAGGDKITHGVCDYAESGSNNKRLCWHAKDPSLLGAGWRCGSKKNLVDNTWERVIFQQHGNIYTTEMY